MAKLRDDVLDEVRGRGGALDLEDLIEILETHRVDGGRGVTRERIEAYAEALDYDLGRVDELLEAHRTDTRNWIEGDVVYQLGTDRYSVYPPRWHEELGDTTDLTKHVALIHESVTSTEGEESTAVTDAGVPRSEVIRVARGVSGMDRETTRGKIGDLRKKGQLESLNDQHPDADIRIPDRE